MAANEAVKGAQVRQAPYPDGVPGTKFSLEEMTKAIQGDMANAKTVTALRSWAGRVLVAAGGPKTETAQAQAILDELRKKTVYVQDPINTEMVVHPKVTLCLEDGQLCIPAADCFPQGTWLLRDDMELVKIEDIKIGDRIWGKDDWTRVENKWFKGELEMDEADLDNGASVLLTPGHKLYVQRCEKCPGAKNKTCTCEGALTQRITMNELCIHDRLIHPTNLSASRDGLGWLVHLRGKREAYGSANRVVRHVQRAVASLPAWDIATSDHYVYLPEHDVTVSNCDDRVAAYIALLMSVGIECRIVAQAFNTPQATHVIAALRDMNTGWRRTDPSHDSWPVGQFHPASKEWWVDPVSGETRHSSDGAILKEGVEPDGVFIGVGAIPFARGISPISHETPEARERHQTYCSNPSCCGTCDDCREDRREDRTPPEKSDQGLGSVGTYPMFHAFSIGSGSASYVPVGMGQGMPAASATGTVPSVMSTLSQDAMSVITSQVQDAIFALEEVRNDLGATLQNITRTRLASRGPTALFDPEPSYTIASVADFPTDGTTWTQSMDVIANQLFDIADRMVGFGYDALAGDRQILVDGSTNGVYVQSKTDDAWSLHAVIQTADKLVLGFFDKSGTLLSGIDTANGASLTADQVKAEAKAAGVTGLGISPVIVVAAVVGIAVVAVAVYYTVKALAAKASVAAHEATQAELIKCVQSGKCDQSVIASNSAAFVAAEQATQADNPIAADLVAAGTIFKWVAVGGIAVSAAVVLGPFIAEVAGPVVKRFASGSGPSGS